MRIATISNIFWTTTLNVAFGATFLTLSFGPNAVFSQVPAANATSDVTQMAAKLCRSGGGDWACGVKFSVKNNSTFDWDENAVALSVAGTPENPVDGALPLVGERAESFRFCDATGSEFVFEIADSTGKSLFRGDVDANSTLTFPATVAAGETATYFVFFRNDAAFPLPDRFEKAVDKPKNLDFEDGAGNVPIGWNFDAGTEGSRTLSWTESGSFSGKKCVRCDVAPNEEPSWIAARQRGIAVESGAKYRFVGYVRGEKIRGLVGWYVHLGNVENSMLATPTIGISGKSDFDWTPLSTEFVVPKNANRLEFGTVLRGTGTAWFDAVSIERVDGDSTAFGPEIVVEKPFDVPVPASVYPCSAPTATRGSATFEPEKLNLDSNARFSTIRVDVPNSDGSRLVRLDLKSFAIRWGRVLKPGDFEIRDLKNRVVDCQYFDDAVFFSVDAVKDARNYFLVVEKNAKNAVENGSKSADFDLNVEKLDDSKKERQNVAKKPFAPQNVANQAFPGTSLQTTNAEKVDESRAAVAGIDVVDPEALALPQFLKERNLLNDGDCENFDVATGLPPKSETSEKTRWARDVDEPGVEYSVVDPGVATLGKKAIQMKIGPEAELKWRGWRRRVPVEPNRTYCFGFAISSPSDEGSFDLHLHQRRADGSLAIGGMGSLGKPTGGNSPWTLKCGSFRTSNDVDFVEFHLTTQTRGTVRFDSLFVAPVDVATPISFLGGKSGVFQVPSVAKVFRDTTFSASEPEIDQKNPAVCALALDEEETLQFAIRSENARIVRLEASAPVAAKNNRQFSLETPDIFAVGNVVVDYPSSYYNMQGSPALRKFPNGSPSTDGWIGYWPDPLIPIRNLAEKDNVGIVGGGVENDVDPRTANDSQILAADGANGTLRLNADETRAVWLRFKTSPQTEPGVYRGTLTLRDGDGNVRVLPYSVEVLAFRAPETKVAAIYDARIKLDYFGVGSYSEKLEKISEKLLERKLSPDKPIVDPVIKYDKTTGVATADWTEYDRVAGRYFDELGGKAAYYPSEFYFFGWGNPPKEVEGEKPYEGEYPYEGVDRSVLRPEYKKAYQAKLKLFWEHLKEKGWADKAVLYISDEPFYSKPEIIVQMKALCATIHEVDPNIPIYCSTWVLVPEWLNSLDVWGVGHYGGVGKAALQQIKDAGGRIWWTTDGQMCLDTPLCATERLLPYTCVARGAELYEFWGATWYTCNPFDTASHLYISQSDQPGVRYYVRYPNGDGYIFYPGDLVGLKGKILDSIRSEQAREGIEDAGWLVGLQTAIAEKTTSNSSERADAQAVLDRALEYLPLECGSGRFSTRYMSDPNEFEQIRLDVGRELEKLTK